MATNNTGEQQLSPEATTPATPEAPKVAKAKAKTEADPRRRLVKIRLQRPANSKSKGQTISVNNYRYFIPYGKTVEVPFFIAEIARMSSEQDEQTMAMIDDLVRPD